MTKDDYIREAIAVLQKALEVEQGAPAPTPQPPVSVGRWDRALVDLETDKPTGAWGMSDQTARHQVNMSGGVAASWRVVDINLGRRPVGWFDTLDRVAEELGLPRQVLYSISCRESHHGHALDSNGEGDRGWAFGAMQVDKRFHQQQGRPDPYSYAHALQAGGIFLDYLGRVERDHPDWEDKYLLKGATVAYNAGPGRVKTIERMDVGSTGNDYGADVMARAQYYLELGI